MRHADSIGKSSRVAEKPAHATILIVDDEPLIRWAIGETLEGEGYDVVEAGDGGAAVRLLRAGDGAADLVLLDLQLPDADDLRILSAIRRASPLTPVIVMTAYGTPELRLDARRLGAFAVMDKPFDLQALPPLVQAGLATRPH